ncbi:MAG: type IV toxin-antitoxin system AbiEi family antitoxin domain-containing protein [Chloroflexi bacterium]|nr:type IV toxin-antitoxin system AbiEi family antitoxin domain-containing protein [Chloroflexota bacterium]MBU1661692.1 type IV toxin-antitoxin system AbiEi family antitoxin domain-containing protein [Chloroflexota bacterium]
MERIKPKDMSLIQRLLSLDKPYFSPADLEKVLGQRRPALYVTLNRLVKYGVLVRLRRGVYQVALQASNLPHIANQLVYPSYLSFESALSRYGILSQVPYVLTFATPRRSRRLTLGDTIVEFRQLKRELFFGYTMQAGLYVAEAEKALLDQLYMISRGLSSLALDELELSPLNAERLQLYAAHFPSTVQATVSLILGNADDVGTLGRYGYD